ncbi:MAG: hypothetical protein ACREQK_13975, partial [Candidatus Binatia bacterium]
PTLAKYQSALDSSRKSVHKKSSGGCTQFLLRSAGDFLLLPGAYCLASGLTTHALLNMPKLLGLGLVRPVPIFSSSFRAEADRNLDEGVLPLSNEYRFDWNSQAR